MQTPAVQLHPTRDVAALRLRYESTCQRLRRTCRNYQIRIHRALSWYERAQALDLQSQSDGRLIYGWIAFNALYGSWDEELGMPRRDGEGWKRFLEELLAIDSQGWLAAELIALEPDVLPLLENRYLDMRFWKNPQQAGSYKRKFHEAQRLYQNRQWAVLLSYVFERVYVLRGQVVHGGATSGSKLNRENLQRCVRILERLLPVILSLAIEQRIDDRWPPLCYPPIEDAAPPPPTRLPR